MDNAVAKATMKDTTTEQSKTKRSGRSNAKRQGGGSFRTGRSTGSRAQKAGSQASSKAQLGSLARGTVTMQARIDADFAIELLENDASILGLTGMSEVVREGLRLLHRRARELALAAEYEQFYGGQPAPLPEGVVPSETN